MTTRPHYMPILKGKEGEYAALEVLAENLRDAVVPFIEVPSVPYDYANEGPAKSLDRHLVGIGTRLSKCWGKREVYLHLPWFEPGESQFLADGTHAVAAVLKDCSVAAVQAIPVISTSSSTEYLNAVRQSTTKYEYCCIRLTVNDFEDDSEHTPEQHVNRLLDAVGRRVAEADLVLDLGELGGESARALLVARAILGETPHSSDWRRVVLAGASFPENLSEVDAATTTKLPRTEWELWKRMQKRKGRDDLMFGDYAIAHPTPTEIDPRTMRMSASIRYTTEDDWLVLKGRNVRQYGFDQFFELCRLLVKRPEYSGKDFSWGDDFIWRCARNETGPGNATTWRKVGTNHHLTLIVRALDASSAGGS